MLHHRATGLGVLLAAASLLPGCFNADSSPTGNSGESGSEEEAIQSIIFDEMSEYADPDVRYYDENDTPPLAPINTHWWRRELVNLDKTIEIIIENPDGEPPTANVTVTAEATGLLHLWACAGDSLAHYVKDFNDSGVRKLYFEKVRPIRPTHRGWRLMAISGVSIASEGTSRSINSVRFQAPEVDVTVTGVDELVWLEDLMRLPRETEVSVTVDTGDASDQVYLHMRRMRRRMKLESNGDGTFSGVFWTSPEPGPRHIVVDVLSEGTIFDDTEAYDSVAWGIPYVIPGPPPPPAGGEG